jgi:hypothetical protein
MFSLNGSIEYVWNKGLTISDHIKIPYNFNYFICSKIFYTNFLHNFVKKPFY